jgi:hypothetical protein
MSDSEVMLDLQQQRIERAIGFELTNTQNIIKRTGVFDEIDKKYGISEEERKKLESASATGEAPGGEGGGLGGALGGSPEPSTPPPATGGGEGPLSEGFDGLISEKKLKLSDLFDFNKAQANIYEIETKINDILND